jgi:hypothetical protein
MAISPRGLLLGTTGLLAARADEVDDLLFARGRKIQTRAAEPANRSRQGAKPVVFRGWDDRDREMAAGDDGSDAASRDLFDQSREGGSSIRQADGPEG